MFHSNTEQLIDYWQRRRIGPMAPARASIDPADFTRFLPQIFILGRRGFGDYGFRLVGGYVADLHGRDLRDENILNLWEPEDRAPLQMALETIRRRAEPLVISCDAWPEFGLAMRLEMMLAPLTGMSGDVDRMLGLYQPTVPSTVLMGQAAKTLSIRQILTGGGVGEAEELPRLRLAAVNGRRIA
ncbi:MAG: PAS domain-containing protein [Caulobacteraceae bacterium]|nr:PAS domain-containing protein [Caulobacteraceae bacterium]